MILKPLQIGDVVSFEYDDTNIIGEVVKIRRTSFILDLKNDVHDKESRCKTFEFSRKQSAITNTKWQEEQNFDSIKIVKVSDIQPDGNKSLIETPTDALRYVSNQSQIDSYIEEFGDRDIYLNVTRYGSTYCVPDFARDIEEYTAMKAEDCRRHGSN